MRKWLFVLFSIIIILCITFLLRNKSFAPIYGFFPGLDNLIERSDVIAVLHISEYGGQPGTAYIGHAPYNVYSYSVIKGDLPDTNQKIWLRDLPWHIEDTFYYPPPSINRILSVGIHGILQV